MGAQWIHGEKGNSAYALAQSFDVLEEQRDIKTKVRNVPSFTFYEL
jgi:hypothetical protein